MYRAPQWGPHFQGPQLLPASNSRCLWWSSRHDVQWWSSGCSAKKRWRWESRGSRIFLGGDDMRKMPINIDSFILFWLCYTYTIYFVRLWDFLQHIPPVPFKINCDLAISTASHGLPDLQCWLDSLHTCMLGGWVRHCGGQWQQWGHPGWTNWNGFEK